MNENDTNKPSPSGNELFDLLNTDLIKGDLTSIIEDHIEIPSSLDDEILNRAKAHFAGMNETKSRFILSNRSLKWIAAAACIGIVSFVAIRFGVLNTDQPALAGDIDRSGRVDILDAFTLARHIETKSVLEDEWDVNADGIINTGDVQFIAKQAVSISEELTAIHFNETDNAERFAILLEGSNL